MTIIIILFVLGNNYTIKIAALNWNFYTTESKIKKCKKEKNHKPFDTLNGSIPRAAILITE